MFLISLIRSVEDLATRLLPGWLASLALRVALAVPFFKSGLTKWDGPGQLSESAVLLFTHEFKLNIFGNAYDFPFPTIMAYGAGIGEIVLPILVVVGLFTRFAALGLLLMTVIVQLTIPSGWPIHLTWAAMAAGVIAIGPGRLSVDSLITRR